jgi:hypothetical protein
MENADGSVRLSGEIEFTSSTNQPVNTANPVTSGTLPAFSAWVSGTSKQNPVSRAITVALAITGDATNNAATVVVAISPNDSDYTTLATVSLAAAVNNTGAITLLNNVQLPYAWYIKLTIGAHASVAASYYY